MATSFGQVDTYKTRLQNFYGTYFQFGHPFCVSNPYPSQDPGCVDFQLALLSRWASNQSRRAGCCYLWKNLIIMKPFYIKVAVAGGACVAFFSEYETVIYILMLPFEVT